MTYGGKDPGGSFVAEVDLYCYEASWTRVLRVGELDLADLEVGNILVKQDTLGI
jgi:hypothetical protein